VSKFDQRGRWANWPAATGLTVRTLHHYDQIGLLCPSRRTEAGHRLYDGSDVSRLYRIVLLRRLDMSLDQVAEALVDPAWSLRAALTRHVAELDRQIAARQSLRQRIGAVLRQAEQGGGADESGAAHVDELLRAMEDMMTLDHSIQRRIALLVYDDIEAAQRYLVEVFGLGPGRVDRDGTGTVVHGEVEAGDGVIWLHRAAPEHGLASPRTLGGATAMTAVMVDDVDAHFARTVAAGGVPSGPPVDQDYGFREYTVPGPEDELWSFMAPLD